MSSPSTPARSITSSSSTPGSAYSASSTNTTSTTPSTPGPSATPSVTPSHVTTPSHYATLKIPITASQSEIRAAFHTHCKMARTRGPTYIPSFHSSARYVQLKGAYDILSDRDDKRKYDIMRAKAGDGEIGERLKREVEEVERQWGEVKKEVKEGKGLGMGEGENWEKHMRGIQEREERRREQREWEEQRVLYVYEGTGEEVVRKWKGRPRGPRVKGTNV